MQTAQTQRLVYAKFLSTPSARRATNAGQLIPFYVDISIHALREEGDGAPRLAHDFLDYFYPRPPRGGRQSGRTSNNPIFRFLSTPSARRATITQAQRLGNANDFYPRPPRGGRRFKPAKILS